MSVHVTTTTDAYLRPGRAAVAAVGTMRALTAAVVAIMAFAILPNYAWATRAPRTGALRTQVVAGYQAAGQVFRHVEARWSVPQITCRGTTGQGDPDSYFWTGLGAGSYNSERVGVRGVCAGRDYTYAAYPR